MKKKKRAGSRFAAAALGFIVIAVLAVCCLIGGLWYADYVPNDILVTDKTITISAGETTSQIADQLQAANVIRYPFFFRLVSRFGGHDGQYKEGTYLLNGSMGYDRIIKIIKGEVKNGATVKVTFPEGFEFRQIVDRLESEGLIDRDEFIEAASTHVFDYPFLKDLPERENRLEGYLFPDTYLFHKEITPDEIITAMLNRFDEIYTAEYEQRAQELRLTTDEVVTLASIIEREAVGDGDRKDVSSVFHNRLDSSEYPYLQSCATVQYILQERKPVLSEQDTRIDSPYNTYINRGLPVGPIASPGKASIEAALYPNDTDYLFFVLGKDGKHIFSQTYEQHLAAMNQ